MKTLYISDLDGTLFDANALVSPRTLRGINALVERGAFFSVATARTAATVTKMLSGLEVNVPAVLMNGVCIYDLADEKYIDIQNIGDLGRRCLIDAVKDFGLDGFLYCIDKGRLSTFYEKIRGEYACAFVRERERLFSKPFTRVGSFSECGGTAVYYSFAASREKLLPAVSALSRCGELRVEFYRDIYHTDQWYMEVCSSGASKKSAVELLRARYGFERIVGFGDNLNDLPLFEACDLCCAVANAKDEIKQAADEVIESNLDDGVVKRMEADFTGDFL